MLTIQDTKKYKSNFIKNKDVLFLSNFKTKICTRAVRWSIKSAYKKVGIDDEEYSVHTLRHPCATLMYKSGVDINTIKELLGHVKID